MVVLEKQENQGNPPNKRKKKKIRATHLVRGNAGRNATHGALCGHAKQVPCVKLVLSLGNGACLGPKTALLADFDV